MKNSNKLEKFDNTLNNLEEEVESLKGTAAAFKRLQRLTLTYEQIKSKFDKNSKLLEDQISRQLLNDGEIQKSLGLLMSENDSNYKDLQETHDKVGKGIESSISKLEKSLNISLDSLRKENKQFYLDFEKVVRIKLDENKSEIRQLIENERLKIKEMVVSAAKEQTNLLMEKQKKTNNLVVSQN